MTHGTVPGIDPDAAFGGPQVSTVRRNVIALHTVGWSNEHVSAGADVRPALDPVDARLARVDVDARLANVDVDADG